MLELRHFETDMRLARLSPVTINSRIGALDRLSRWLGIPLITATSDQLIAYQRTLVRLRPASVDIYTRHIQAFYGWALDRHLISTDPSQGLVTTKVRRGKPHPTSVEDLRTVFATTRGPLRIAYALATMAGLRCAEICQLQRHDIQLGPNATADILGKGDKARTVPLIPPLVEELQDYGLRSGYVIVTEIGTAWTPRRLSSTSSTYLRDIGIPSTLHSMRHAFLTNAARMTHDPLFVRDLAGHESVATTEIYMDTDMTDAHAKLAPMNAVALDLLGNRRLSLVR